MDRLTSYMLRTSLIWLISGFTIGAAMLVDRRLPGDWRLWLSAGHAHMLFVGWFVQFAIGVAFWLLPRKRSDSRPLGYNAELAMTAAILLNIGLAMRVATEAIERTGRVTDLSLAVLAISALAQLAAVLIFSSQLWPRISPRPIRGQGSTQKG